jgi:hypothetical protein
MAIEAAEKEDDVSASGSRPSVEQAGIESLSKETNRGEVQNQGGDWSIRSCLNDEGH